MRVAHDHRRRLAEETGLEPSPALGALEQRIAAGTQPPSPSPSATATSLRSRPASPSSVATPSWRLSPGCAAPNRWSRCSGPAAWARPVSPSKWQPGTARAGPWSPCSWPPLPRRPSPTLWPSPWGCGGTSTTRRRHRGPARVEAIVSSCSTTASMSCGRCADSSTCSPSRAPS